jgi:hypothetical protein
MLPDLYPSIHQACCLFEALHAPLHDGEQSEIRWSSPHTRGSMRRKFFASTEAAAHEAISLGVFCDVYVGAAPRWGSDGTGVGVRRLGAVWADLDAKGEHTVGSRLRCDPPLEATEVLRIARSVGRYAVGSPKYRSSPVRRVRRNAEEV